MIPLFSLALGNSLRFSGPDRPGWQELTAEERAALTYLELWGWPPVQILEKRPGADPETGPGKRGAGGVS